MPSSISTSATKKSSSQKGGEAQARGNNDQEQQQATMLVPTVHKKPLRMRRRSSITHIMDNNQGQGQEVCPLMYYHLSSEHLNELVENDDNDDDDESVAEAEGTHFPVEPHPFRDLMDF